MANYTRITLLNARRRIARDRSSLANSLELLQDNKSTYAAHHRYCIDIYDDLIETLDTAITDSESIE